jgi:hypothetical protein
MNQIVPQQPAAQQLQVPAHLAHLYAQLPATNLGAEVAAGISSMAHNRISIRQARWRLVNTQGEETVVSTFHLDVLIVDANPHTSKTYYEGAYNANSDENAPPRCWSDNGYAPSERVSNPINYTCANCPMNVFGSKITPNGKKARACGDSKRLAVVLADNPDGLIYELRVPAASLTNMANAMNDMIKRGVRIETIIWRLEFDPQADHPKITFTPAGWVNETQMANVMRLLGSDEAADVVNKNDKPLDAAGRPAVAPAATPAQLQAPVPQSAPNLQAPQYAPQQVHPSHAAHVGQVLPQTAPLPQQLPPQHPQQFAAAAPATPPAMTANAGIAAPAVNSVPTSTAVAPNNPLGFALPPLPQATPGVPIQAESMPAESQPKRKRRSKAEVEAERAAQANAQAAQYTAPPAPPAMAPSMPMSVAQDFSMTASPSSPMQAMPPLPPMGAYTPPPAPANTDVAHAIPAAAAVPVHPQPTSPQLDQLLANIPM